MTDSTGSTEVSGWAVGWTVFAATMMIIAGALHAMVGLVAIIDDEFYVVTRRYVFELDSTGWGWIHLILGIGVAVAGVYLYTGSVAARTVGVVLAGLSLLAGFAWMPYFPVWGITLVAIATAVIWALTAHGRDIVERT
jgi:hypothetical protein